MAGTQTDKILTAEPAVAVPAGTDANERESPSRGELPQIVIPKGSNEEAPESKSPRDGLPSRGSQQFGAVMRRSMMIMPSANGLVQTEAEGLEEDSADATTIDDGTETAVKISSLGRIREGENGEMYILGSIATETAKDK